MILNVHHIHQGVQADCVPACVAMVLEYLGLSVSVEQLKGILGTHEAGTVASQIRNLESLNLTVIYKRGTFAELNDHLVSDHPCIAFVMTGQLPYWNNNRSHAVVVVGLDNDRVYLNDPELNFGPIQVSRGDFDLAWLEWDEMYATLIKKT